MRQSTSIIGCVRWSVGRVTHSFNDSPGAPYWPTWPRFVIFQANFAEFLCVAAIFHIRYLPDKTISWAAYLISITMAKKKKKKRKKKKKKKTRNAGLQCCHIRHGWGRGFQPLFAPPPPSLQNAHTEAKYAFLNLLLVRYGWTNIPMDRQTDRWKDRASYRVTSPQLK